jgi:hypothetical protein
MNNFINHGHIEWHLLKFEKIRIWHLHDTYKKVSLERVETSKVFYEILKILIHFGNSFSSF